MSIHEVLVFAALASVGGFAWYLCRQETRPRSAGGETPDYPPGRPMFGRPLPSGTADKK